MDWENDQKYIEDGMKDTGAVNIVAGMILDYRAFDTLGESFVLFTAVTCVLVLLTDFKGKKIIDVGTGAGFPGMVISLLLGTDVDLLDSTNKKLNVINDFGNELVHTINERVEEYSKKHRENYDIVIARAVAPLNILSELCLPLVKVGGYFIAMKGSDGEAELDLASKAIDKLGGKLVKTDKHSLPNGDIRINFLIRKDKVTNEKYPRSFGEIKNKPL